MNEMIPSGDALQREKMLYRYSTALERGDFETVAAVLKQAEKDPALERMILDINMAYQEDLPLEHSRMSEETSIWDLLGDLWSRIIRRQGHKQPKRMGVNQKKKMPVRGINMRTILVSGLVLVLVILGIVMSGILYNHNPVLLLALSTPTPAGFHGYPIPAGAPTEARAPPVPPAGIAPRAAPAAPAAPAPTAAAAQPAS